MSLAAIPQLTTQNFVDVLPVIEAYLRGRGTISLVPTAHAVYSAVGATSDAADVTGYKYAWLRDNAMIAYALWSCGETAAARETIQSLGRFLEMQRPRMEAIIREPALKNQISFRPRIRFDPDLLRDLDESWANAQNDALAQVMWLRCVMANSENGAELNADEQVIYGALARYFGAIEYWADADNGMWEEELKVNASSVGCVVAALMEWQKCSRESSEWVPLGTLREWIGRGRACLKELLPFESPPGRLADAALLFLIYPLNVITVMGSDGGSRSCEDRILALVRARLLGEIGISRYVGDSYFCQDYDEWFSPSEQSANFSENLAFRNALLKPGCEAQWCLFDPILSAIYGRRFTEEPARLDWLTAQLWHFNRAMSQLTPDGQCAELYYLKHGHWTVNSHTPLSWTQANTAVALQCLKASAFRFSQSRATLA